MADVGALIGGAIALIGAGALALFAKGKWAQHKASLKAEGHEDARRDQAAAAKTVGDILAKRDAEIDAATRAKQAEIAAKRDASLARDPTPEEVRALIDKWKHK